jgi:hypothetical protein
MINRIWRGAALTVLVALLPLGAAVAQQSGTVTGKVVDASTGDPIVGGTVVIEGTKLGSLTSTSGTFTIRRVPYGQHTVKASGMGYAPQIVRGIAVANERPVALDFTLSTKAVEREAVTVVGKMDRQSENAALTARRRSAQVSDAISSEQMSRAQAGDAGDAMKRVTGVSVIGDKYVVVRGLQERYSSTQLNNVNLPSPEPEKKVVPFDLFPSSMVSRLTTIKTFTPDNPGDFAGGLVKIETKEFPEAFLFSSSVSTGMNSVTQGADAIGYVGGSTDFLGIDDGTRALPADIGAGRRQSNEAQADLLSRFSNRVYSPRAATMPMNGGFNLSVGDQLDAGFPVGVLFSGSYSGSASYREEEQRHPILQRGEDGRRDLRYAYAVRRSERSALWGGLLNLSAQFAPEHKVGFKAIYNRSSEDETRLVEGTYNQSTVGEIRYSRLRFVERALGSLQLDGEHKLTGVLDSKLDWRAAFSTADRLEPDNRSVTYFRSAGDSTYAFANNFGSNNGRFFSDLADRETNVGLDWTIPLGIADEGSSRLKVGGLGRLRDRDFSARRFLFGTNSSDFDLLSRRPEELFTPDNVRSGAITFNDATAPTDAYAAREALVAGYAMVDIPLWETLRIIAGARVEHWDLDLDAINAVSGAVNPALGTSRAQTDVMPSLNLIYRVNPEMNMRASVSQTVARPEFRELAPFRFDDYRQSTYGNPALERTKILNLDARWEWFPSGGEVIAISAFTKHFTDPIEQFYLVGSGISVEPANADDAVVYGAELELRRSLEFLDESLASLAIGTNLTIVDSRVSFSEGEFVEVFDGIGTTQYSPLVLTSQERPLQGQSPYVINATISYDRADWGTSATLLYNVFGPRLAVVGTEGIPDTYEQGRHSLDVSLSQKLPSGLQLRVSARNLLDAETLFEQRFADGETVVAERFITGRSLSIGLSFNFDQLQLQNVEQ